MRGIVCSVTILLLFFPAPAYSQAPSGALQGVVIDNTSEEPIAGAWVQLLDGRNRAVGQVIADDAGRFRFSNVRSGAFSIRAGRIGYSAASTPEWRVVNRETLEVEVRLDVESIPLAPLTVVASTRTVGPSPVLRDYRHRLESGIGTFITREEMESRPRALVTDYLATIPSVRLVSSGAGLRRIVYMNRGLPGRDLPAQIYVDGRLLNRSGASIAIDDVVNPSVVEGIEVYRGLSGVPAEFMSPEAVHGVIVIWTRRGDAR